jgi:hypothetical protein
MPENRKFPRIQHSGICILTRECSDEIETWSVNVVNISVIGALVECPGDWPGLKNDNVRITLILDGSDVELKLSAFIVHQDPAVLGLKFLTLNLKDMSHLQDLIALDFVE